MGQERNSKVLTSEDIGDSLQPKKTNFATVVYGSGNTSFVRSNSPVYTEGGQFVFPGTNKTGDISRMTGIGMISNAAGNADFRIYDETNGQIICEATGITNTSFDSFDFGVLSNLPSGEAIFSIQLRRNINGKARLKSLTFEF